MANRRSESNEALYGRLQLLAHVIHHAQQEIRIASFEIDDIANELKMRLMQGITYPDNHTE